MKKMKMSDVEIMDYYDAAVDKEKAIDALAIKCRMTRTMMRDKLGELGVLIDAPEVARHTHTHTHTAAPAFDEIRAMELFREGLDDLAMAETLGISKEKVKAWRKRMHLQRPRGAAAHKKKGGASVKFKERTTEEAVIEQEEKREQAFQEILESVDAGKQMAPEAPEELPAASPCCCQPAKPVDVWKDYHVPVPGETENMTAPETDGAMGMTVGELFDFLQYAKSEGLVMVGDKPVRFIESTFCREAGGKVVHAVRLEAY